MASVNKAILIGHLGAKPELKYLPSGQAVAELRIATNERWRDKQEQVQEKVEWHRVVAWGKQAENVAQYLDKGRQVYVEGRLQTRSWDDKTTGEKKYATEIVAQNVVFLGGGEARPGGGTRRPTPTGEGSGSGAPDGGEQNWGPPGGGDDDIPF